ncbi:MAG TPA: DUF202 domain-containing protein [Propionibacteriaceae bacterium]|nr:DUF202 domain-containing protein [Propionibacteriaceae bacterium]
MSTAPPWDPGLQNERTGLAWQRTMLAGLVCSLLVTRLLAELSPLLAVLTGLAALLATAGLGWMAIRRFRRHSTALHAQRPIGDGRPQALISVVVALTAVGALVFAVLA